MLILLRHGRTLANARGLLQGRIDPELDELGRRQARAAAKAIGPVDRVVTSPLRRARQTAETFGLAVDIDERFIELDYGDWEGKPVADVPSATWERWRIDLDFRPPNGETLNELGERVRVGLAELSAQAVDSTVVIVSHVSPIKAATAWSLGVGDELTWRLYLGQASICRIDVSGMLPRLIEFNATAHLDGIDK